MHNPTDKALINFQVIRKVRQNFKIACATLGTTMTAVLVGAVDETIKRADAVRKEWAKDG